MMANPEELIEKGHQLLKAIPASGLKTVIDLLELIVSQQKSQKELEDFLKNCPIEDEDISEEEERAVAEAIEDVKRGNVKPWGQVKKEMESWS